jgi:hypothetical protein
MLPTYLLIFCILGPLCLWGKGGVKCISSSAKCECKNENLEGNVRSEENSKFCEVSADEQDYFMTSAKIR